MNTLLKKIASACVLSMVLALPLVVHAGGLGDAGALFVQAGERAYGGQPADLGTMFASVARSALSLLGIIFVGLTIYGGFLWMTAGGSKDNVDKARRVLTQAIIGLAIVLLTRGISEFVIRTFFEATGA